MSTLVSPRQNVRPSKMRRPPKMRRQKGGGPEGADRAFVELGGTRHYLGEFGCADSRQQYDRLIAEWLANGRELPPEPVAQERTTIRMVIHDYWKWVKANYANKGTRADIRFAIRPLFRMYGHQPVEEFTPKRLMAFRQQLIDGDERLKVHALNRRTINRRIKMIRAMFKWAVQQELVPASVWHALLAVTGLRRGRSAAKETPMVGPVALEHVYAVQRFVSRQVWALIQLQLCNAARPGELVGLRAKEIDRSKKLWEYRPVHHKTVNHDHPRVIWFNPEAQAILKEFIEGRDENLSLFSPTEAEAERRAERHARRKTPMNMGNLPGSKHCKTPSRPLGEAYTVASYRRAVARACRKADAWEKGGRVVANEEVVVPTWHPHQLRHTAGTQLRRDHGPDVAQVILGHREIATTEVYAEPDWEKAKAAMMRTR